MTNNTLARVVSMFVNTAMPVRPTHNYAANSTPGVVLRHEQFHKDLGSHSITVGNAGWYLDDDGKVRRYPVIVMCDPLDQNEGGLMPNSGPIYDQAQLFTSYVVNQRILMAIVADAHVNQQHVNLDAPTKHLLTVDIYNQLTADEQQRADRYFIDSMEIPPADVRREQIQRALNKQASASEVRSAKRWQRYAQEGIDLPDAGQPAKPLFVNDVELLYGPSPDGEFRPFLFGFEHCVEPTQTGGKGLHKWVPFVAEIISDVQADIARQRQQGIASPHVRIASFHKNDLRPAVSNGARGTDGNLLEEFLLASQYGHPQGPEHDMERKMVVFLMGTPYTTLYAILNGLALGFRVQLQMDCTFNFDAAGVSMIELVRVLRHMFPNAFEAVIGWNKEWMGGPQPVANNGRTFNQSAARIKTLLEEHLGQTLATALNMQFYAFGDPDDLRDVITDFTV